MKYSYIGKNNVNNIKKYIKFPKALEAEWFQRYFFKGQKEFKSSQKISNNTVRSWDLPINDNYFKETFLKSRKEYKSSQKVSNNTVISRDLPINEN